MVIWVDVFLLKTLLKILKTLPELKQFWKTCYTTKFAVFAKGKKTSPFFLKDLCQIYSVQKTKRTFLKTFCFNAGVNSFGLQKEKENKAFIYKAFDLNDKTLLILFKLKFSHGQKQNREHLPLKKTALFCFCLFRICFFFQVSKMKKQKTNKRGQKLFFSFCQYA